MFYFKDVVSLSELVCSNRNFMNVIHPYITNQFITEGTMFSFQNIEVALIIQLYKRQRNKYLKNYTGI